MVLCHSGAMRIAVYAFDGVTMFHLAAPLMVFGELGRLGLAPDWETRLWSDRPGTVRTDEGYPIGDVEGPELTEWADILIVPSWPVTLVPSSEDFRARLRRAHSRGATIVGLCLGAFPVADSGLLDDRPAVTHWEMLPELGARLPGTPIQTSVLYIDHGDVLTSAGTASAIDACLHLVRRHLGAAVATRVARSLVVAPHREGGQSQFIERPLAQTPGNTAIAEVQQWALGHLAGDLSVGSLAAHANMSRRSFIRQFTDTTGTTPARWVLRQRLDQARMLLETTDWSIGVIATACGFVSAVTFRQNFGAAFATSPTAYRRHFAGAGLLRTGN
jgi:transcriptional regulator GlxA family with amidase domain